MYKQQSDESRNETKMWSELHSLLKNNIQNSSLSLMMEKKRIKAPPKPTLPPTVIQVTEHLSPSANKESVLEKN